MRAEQWFGDLKLAYKYIIIFLSLLLLVTIAGFFKLLHNNRKLKKARVAELEAGPSRETEDLNQREKDEGDLFGIRAIEAGFYAGVAQSQPTSRAGSAMSMHRPGTGNSTLVGGNSSLGLLKYASNNSALNLQLGENQVSPLPRAVSPVPKLRPSDAELNGRRHHGAVGVGVVAQRATQQGLSPTFDDSDSESDDYTNPRSSSSSGNSTMLQSGPPSAQLPRLPTNTLRNASRSPSPEGRRPEVRVYEPNSEPVAPFSLLQLQPRTYAPSHARGASDANSLSGYELHPSSMEAVQAYPDPMDGQRLSTLQPNEAKDARLSEFYEAYYRRSQIAAAGPAEDSNRAAFSRHSMIPEVDSPLTSPLFPAAASHGAAF